MKKSKIERKITYTEREKTEQDRDIKRENKLKQKKLTEETNILQKRRKYKGR